MDDNQDDSREGAFALGVVDANAGNGVVAAQDVRTEDDNTARARETGAVVCQPAGCRKNCGSELVNDDNSLLNKGVTYGSKDDLKNFAKVLHKHGSGCDSSSFCQQFDFNLTAGVLLDKKIFTIVNEKYETGTCWEKLSGFEKGSHGICRLTRDLHTGNWYCSKEIPWSQFHSQEVLSLLILDHDCVVKVLGLLLENHFVYILMELCKGCLLRDVKVDKSVNYAREQLAINIQVQLLSVLQHMKEHGIVHGDLHDKNVIVTENSLIKVVDFGCSRDLSVHTEHLNVSDKRSLGRLSGSSSGGRFADDTWSAFMLMYTQLLDGHFTDVTYVLRKCNSREEKLQALSAVENERLRAILAIALVEDDPDLCVLEDMLIQASEEIHIRMYAQQAIESVAEEPIEPEPAQMIPVTVNAYQDVPQPLEQIVPEPAADRNLIPEFASYLQGVQELVLVMQQICESIGDQQQFPEPRLSSVLNEVRQFSDTGPDVSELPSQEFSATRFESERADSEMPRVGFNGNCSHNEVVDDDETDFIYKIPGNCTTDDMQQAGSDANMNAGDANMDSGYLSISFSSWYCQCSDTVEGDRPVDFSDYCAALKNGVQGIDSEFRINGDKLAIARSNNHSWPVNAHCDAVNISVSSNSQLVSYDVLRSCLKMPTRRHASLLSAMGGR